MTVSVSSILDTCRLQLMDDTNVRWTSSELLGYVNDAEREIVNYKPDAIVKNKNVVLTAGSKQTVPTSESPIRILSIVRNAGGSISVTANTSFVVGEAISGETSSATAIVAAKSGTSKLLLKDVVGTFSLNENLLGPASAARSTVSGLYAAVTRSVRPVSRETLDRFIPTWHGSTQTAEVQHSIYNELDPTNFYVYPPNNGLGQVEVMFTKHPDTKVETAVAADSANGIAANNNTNLEVADAYANCVIDYVLYRALGKDGDVETSAARSATYYTAFINALNGKQGVDTSTSPRVEPINVPAARQVPVQ